MSNIRFTKMHGCGNDYIYVNAMQYHIANPEAVAQQVSDRHKGVGSDGLVLIDRSSVPEADFSMRIFNADGSEAMMCGNASRCIAKYVFERGLTDKTEVRLQTLSGIKTLHLHLYNNKVERVTVDMGVPQTDDPGQYVAQRGLDQGTFVSMGNPHYVIFTDDVEQVGQTGPVLEHHSAFPQRCNIEFAHILPPSADSLAASEQNVSAKELKPVIRTRVWERGSGITQACGTGACATAVAAFITGKAGRSSTIVMDGGSLDIEWRQSDDHVYMTGPAAFVFDGEIAL